MAEHHVRQRAAAARQTARQRVAQQEATEREAAEQEAVRQRAAQQKAIERVAALRRAAQQLAAQLEAAELEAAELEADEQAAERVAALRHAAQRMAVKLEAAEREATELGADDQAAVVVTSSQRATQQEAAEREAARQRIIQREAAEQKAAEREAARQRAAEREVAEEQALTSSISRKLVRASNQATVVLEEDAAYSKLAYSRLRARDLPFFQEQAQLEREQYLTQMMITAGRGLVDAFTDLLNARTFWDRMASSENKTGQALAKATCPFRVRMELAELLTHHIPELLLNLGYRPPPPTEIWADRLQNSVLELLTAHEDTKAFARNSAKVQQELIFFTRRLRALVEAAERSKTAAGEHDKPRSGRFLHSLRAVISEARSRAVPAALAAGVGAAVVGAGGGPDVMGMAFLSSGAASLLGTTTEAAAMTWLEQEGLHGDTSAISTSQLVQVDIGALDDCIELMRSATSNTIEGIRFIIRRGVFQVLQDAADYSITVRDSLWNWSTDLLSLVDSATFPTDEAHQMVRSVREIVANASGSEAQ